MENLDSSSENDQIDKGSYDSFEDFGKGFGGKAPEKMKPLSEVLPLYRSQHICNLESYKFCSSNDHCFVPLVDFKDKFRESFLSDPKLQPFEDKDLSIVYRN